MSAEFDRTEVRLLAEQLTRMRAMLYAYSDLFFRRIRDWTLVVLVLLVLGSTEAFPAAVVPVPFLVPFAFLETGYLYWYTIFARRHAAAVERAINARFGRDVLVAHRLEAAFFHPPESPRIAAFSVARPTGFMSVATLGYSAGAAVLWVAGMVGLAGFVERVGGGGLLDLALPGALAWTAAIAAYLVWTSLARPDESRLERAIEASYRVPAGDDPRPPRGPR